MKKWNLGIIGLLTVLISSCETDVDLIQEYEPDSFVFGLLDQNADTQFVRVNRAFLGTLSVEEMASVGDSINYNPDDLIVEINSIVLKEFRDRKKNTGFFNNDSYIVYYTTEPVSYNINNQVVDYSLKVINNKTGKVIETNSPIQLVQDVVTLTKPNTNSQSVSLTRTTPQGERLQASYDIEWPPTENAVKHEVYVTFYYDEINLSTNDTSTYSFDFLVSTVNSSQKNRVDLKTGFSPSGFYSQIGRELETKNGIERINPRIAIYMIIANQEFSLYVNASSPSDDLNQNKPSYSNLSNGLGIFGARYERYVLPRNNEQRRDKDKGLIFSQKSLEMLISLEETRDLRFKQI